MRWLDSITDMSLSKPLETVKDREAWSVLWQSMGPQTVRHDSVTGQQQQPNDKRSVQNVLIKVPGILRESVQVSG